MRRSLVVVSAGLSDPSSTRLLADRLAAAAEHELSALGEEVEVSHIELRPLAHALADRMLTGFAAGDLAAALDAATHADALVVATPVFTASYSGLFKMFVDAVPRDGLRGTPVLIAATAGTTRHSLVLDHALRPLFAYLQASVVPTGVFAASEDFGSTADGSLGTRVDRAAGELAAMVAPTTSRSRRLHAVTDDPDHEAADGDELPEPLPFEQLLRGR